MTCYTNKLNLLTAYMIKPVHELSLKTVLKEQIWVWQICWGDVSAQHREFFADGASVNTYLRVYVDYF
jgi:hypothetical protein